MYWAKYSIKALQKIFAIIIELLSVDTWLYMHAVYNVYQIMI